MSTAKFTAFVGVGADAKLAVDAPVDTARPHTRTYRAQGHARAGPAPLALETAPALIRSTLAPHE